jgi:hypothetical protein
MFQGLEGRMADQVMGLVLWVGLAGAATGAIGHWFLSGFHVTCSVERVEPEH